MEFIHLALAGTGKLILDWVWGFGVVGILLFAAFGTALIAAVPVVGPPVAKALKPVREYLILAAVFVAGALAWGAHLQHDEALRCKAQTVVITKTVDKAHTKAVEHPSNSSQWETDQ